mmetsp:Transcript_52181/g.154005  ORF Transcript_52181/g.154005 Transcript_52181/m.154005 type:complete len:168 (-) Transcript_52181:66-569(-)
MSLGGARPVLVYYFIPGDNDDVEHPNAFEVPSSGGGVKLCDVRARFPLPGKYHFRFRMRWEASQIWMDVTNEQSAVPVYEDKIVAKVLRINWGEGRPNKAAPAAAAVASAAAPQAAQRPPAPAPQADMLDFGGPAAHMSPPRGSPQISPGGSPSQAKGGDDFDMLFS